MKGWKWSAQPSLFGMGLWLLTFAAYVELPHAYTEFRHGLALGVALMCLLQMLREKLLGYSIVAALGAFVLTRCGPASAQRSFWLDQVVVALFLGAWIARVVHQALARRREATPAH